MLKPLSLAQKNDQIIRLLFDAVEGGSIVEVEYALRDDNWQFFNLKKLFNQLFFPTPHAAIGKNIFLERPLFNGDEEFADLY
jgi:hypothetical protein